MKKVPPTYPSQPISQVETHEWPSSHAVADDDWLGALLQQQAGFDEAVDQGFCAALMQILPPQAERMPQLAPLPKGTTPTLGDASVLPAWLAAALPWLGLYGLIVTAATMLWLAMTLAVLPGAGLPPLFGSGMVEPWEEPADFLGAGLAHWLAPTVILGWLAWWLREQEWLMN
jgi:hypothetical protein